MKRTSQLVLLGYALLAAGPALAQALRDPTQPPSAFESTQGQAEGRPSGPELQSILISPTRKVAIINGQRVQLGEKYGDAKVVKITESEVTLRSGADVQVLKLFPNVDMQSSSARKAGGEPRRK